MTLKMSFKHVLFVDGLFVMCLWLHCAQVVPLPRDTSEKTPICCLPSDCQAFVYEDYSGNLFGLILYQNSSGQAAYSWTDKKMLNNQTGMLSDVGEGFLTNDWGIWDYVKVIQY